MKSIYQNSPDDSVVIHKHAETVQGNLSEREARKKIAALKAEAGRGLPRHRLIHQRAVAFTVTTIEVTTVYQRKDPAVKHSSKKHRH